MHHHRRIALVALVSILAIAAAGSATRVRSQPTPPGAQTGNRAIQYALDTLQGNVETYANHKTPPQLSAGKYDIAQQLLTARNPDANLSVNGLGPPPLAVTLHTNGCSNEFSGRPDNVRVNQDCGLRRQAEQFISINPTDPKNLVAGQNDNRIGFNKCGIDYSLDRGRHWGDMLPAFYGFVAKDGHTFDAASDPAITHDSRGNAYFACVLFDLNSPASAILLLKSNAVFKGSFFHSPNPVTPISQPFRVDPGVVVNDNDAGIVHDKEFITADQHASSPKRDNVYVTWTRFRFACGSKGTGFCESPIYFSQSVNGSAAWSKPVEISGTNAAICNFANAFDPTVDKNRCNFDQGSYPVVAPDGTIHVVFNNGNTPDLPNQQLVVTCPASKDCAQASSWSSPVKVADDFGLQPFNLPTSPICTGLAPNDIRRCLPPNGFRMNDFPSMAVDRKSGALYVVWADFRNGGPCFIDPTFGLPTEPCANHDNDVFISKSTDGGATWSAVRKVNQDKDGAAQVFPWVAVGGNGTVYVGYYDRRYGCETFGCVDFTLSASTNGGTSWTDRRITTSSMPGPETSVNQAGFLGDYNSLAADNEGVVMVWADTRGLYGQNEQDIYFAAVPAIGGSGAIGADDAQGCTGRGCATPAATPQPRR